MNQASEESPRRDVDEDQLAKVVHGMLVPSIGPVLANLGVMWLLVGLIVWGLFHFLSTIGAVLAMLLLILAADATRRVLRMHRETVAEGRDFLDREGGRFGPDA